MAEPKTLREAILKRLSQVIDPESGVDVVRMRLIEDLEVEADGRVRYKFRPSSPFCPIAVPLAQQIGKAILDVEGVTSQEVEIVGYISSEELTEWLRRDLKTKP